ncbi:hypothetical protein BDV12DRAFT_203388 [Aspergillus spectabilis]
MVSREMNDPSRSVCDSMIWSVVCLAHNQPDDNLSSVQKTPFTAWMSRLQWLDIYGSLKPNLMHIKGLIQMVNLRGGLDKIGLPGLAAVISFSDIVTSSTFLLSPVFPFVPLREDRKDKTLQELLGYTSTLVDQYSSHFQRLGLPIQLADIICAMNTFTELVERFKDERNCDPCLLSDQRNACQHALLSLCSVNQEIGKTLLSPYETTYEACRLACLVYGVGVILPLPGQSTPLGRLANLIQGVLESSNSYAIWNGEQPEAALLWVLMLGGIAAEGFPNRFWYVEKLQKVISRSKIVSWPNMCRVLGSIAWWPSACSKPGHDLWVEVEILRGVF